MNKILFLGAKEIGYYCLNFLISNSKELKSEVVGVLTNKQRHNEKYDFSKLCQENKIQLYDKLDDILFLSNIDYIISVQYHEILKQKHIDIASKIVVNLHMAPLPEYRGCNQFSYAIIDGKKEFGTTIHVMESGIDNGDLLFERRFEIEDDILVGELLQKTVEESKILFRSSVEALLQMKIEPVKQKDLEINRGSSFHLRNEMEKLKEIDVLNWSEDKIDKHLRGTYMKNFSPPYMIISGRRYSITPQE